MTYTTLIKFAPLTTLDRVNDTRLQAPRTLYDPGALKFLPTQDTVPLLVNHDESREIGHVRELMRFEDTDGPWLVAHATVTAEPPAWLKRGVGASFACKSLLENPTCSAAKVVRRVLVTEVSVLSPGCKPAEPAALVLLIRENPNPILSERSPVAAPPGPAGAAPGVFYGGQTIRRPIGQVLGVR